MSKIKRICVMISGGGSNLQALIDQQKAGRSPNGEIVLVISSLRSAYGLERASENGIPTEVVRRRDYADIAEFDNKLLELMNEYRIDLVVLAGYLSILGEGFTAKYANRIINVHPALIPSFCGSGFYGLRVHEAALERGVKVTGATVHFVNEVVDGGEIIYQKAVDVLEGDTAETLQKRVMQEAEWILLPKAVKMYCDRLVN